MVQHHPANDSSHLSGILAHGGNTNNTGSIWTVLVEAFWKRKVAIASKVSIYIQPLRLQLKETGRNNSSTWQIDYTRSRNASMRSLVSNKLFVKWPVYQQELHSVRYKFPLMLDELFQTWSPPSPSVPLSLAISLFLWDTSTTGKVN